MSAQATGHNLPQWTLGERLQKARTHAGLSRDDWRGGLTTKEFQ